jgi:hypothetical protein
VRLDYGMARTVSFACFLIAVGLCARALVRHQEGRLEGWALGAFAAGCAAAGAPIFEGFYDLVREDVMAVLFCVLCAVLAGGPKRMSPRRIAALAFTIGAVVYTRLPAVFFPVWVTIFVFARHRRTGVLLAISAAAVCGLTLVALQYASHGWYWMYTITLLQDQALIPTRFLLGLQILIKFAPFLWALPPLVIALAVARRLSAETVLWFGMLVVSIPAALLPFAKVGGFGNDFMPMFFMIGPATAFVVSDLWRALEPRPRNRLAALSLLCAGSAAFLGVRTWDVKRLTPTEDAFRKARAMNEKVASLDGGVLCPRHPFTPIHNGSKNLGFSDMPYLDMAWSNYGDLNLGGYIDRSKAKWAAIMGTEVQLTTRELVSRYQLEGSIGDAPVTITGERSQLRYLLRLQDSEKDARVLFDFEKDLDGWKVEGDAWQLTPPKPKWQAQIYGAVGSQLANSFHPTKKDTATGTLTSPKFVIDRWHMAFRIGGGWKNGTRVELRVGGRVERKASGIFEYNETMIKVVWDVHAFLGKEAQLVLIDQDPGPWGHLMVDHVILY